jgi:hypothetical protein
VVDVKVFEDRVIQGASCGVYSLSEPLAMLRCYLKVLYPDVALARDVNCGRQVITTSENGPVSAFPLMVIQAFGVPEPGIIMSSS